MADVYSTLLFRAVGLTGTGVYTVPLGFTAVAVCADIYSAPTVVSEIFFEDSHTGGTIFVASIGVTDPPKSFQWVGRQVANEGEGFLFNVAHGAWDVRLSGYLLSNP